MGWLSTSWAVDVLKYGGFSATLIAGIYALIVDFRPKRSEKRLGLLTLHGWLGISLSVLGSLASLIGNNLKEAADARDQDAYRRKELQQLATISTNLRATSETTNAVSSNLNGAIDQISSQSKKLGTVLNQTNRGLRPLRSLEFSFELVLPSDHPEVQAINNELEVYMSPDRRHLLAGDHYENSNWSVAQPAAFSGSTSKLTSIEIPTSSSLYPKHGTALSYLVTDAQVGLDFWKAAPKEATSQLFKSAGNLHLVLNAGTIDSEARAHVGATAPSQLLYNLDKKKLSVLVWKITADPRYWVSDGSIVSSNDIPSCLLAVRLFQAFGTELERSLLSQTKLEYFSLTVPGDRRFVARPVVPKPVMDSGLPIFVVRLSPDR